MGLSHSCPTFRFGFSHECHAIGSFSGLTPLFTVTGPGPQGTGYAQQKCRLSLFCRLQETLKFGCTNKSSRSNLKRPDFLAADKPSKRGPTQAKFTARFIHRENTKRGLVSGLVCIPFHAITVISVNASIKTLDTHETGFFSFTYSVDRRFHQLVQRVAVFLMKNDLDTLRGAKHVYVDNVVFSDGYCTSLRQHPLFQQP